MKKIIGVLLMSTFAITVVAQVTYSGFSSQKIRTNINDSTADYHVVTSVEPLSPADIAGLRPMDLILSVNDQPYTGGRLTSPNVVMKVKRTGNKDLTFQFSPMEIARSYVSEGDWASLGIGSGIDFYSTEKTLNIEPIQVSADPDVSLYEYETFDFDFYGKNALLQKEISSYLEPILTAKGLKRDKDNPDIIVLIDFFSDRRDQYIPPTERIITRYKYGYEYKSGWGTRQYIESEKSGDYTQTEYLTKLAITMLDAKKMTSDKKESPQIWGANYDILHSEKANIADFSTLIGFEMLNCFPVKNVGRVLGKEYYAIGVIYDAFTNGRVVGILPNSPAAKAGIEVGDRLLKSTPGSSKFPVDCNSTQQMLGQKYHTNHEDFKLNRSSNSSYYNTPNYMRKMYIVLPIDSPIVITLKKANGQKRTVTVKAECCRCLDYYLE